MKNTLLKTVSVLNFLESLADYISLPVIAVFLSKKVSLFEVGILMGMPMTVSTLLGFTSYVLDNKLKPSESLTLSILFSLICCLGYLHTQTFHWLLGFSLIKGASRVFWIPITKRLFSHSVENEIDRDKGFRVRYTTICLASIIGPLICTLVIFFFTDRAAIYMSIIVYMITIALIYTLKDFINTHSLIMATNNNVFKLDRLGNINTTLFCYILGGGLVYLAFYQFESTFSLFLKFFFEKPELIFSNLLILNAILGILMQAVFILYPLKYPSKIIITIGNFMFAAGFLLFAISRGRIYVLVFGVIIYSIGEILTIPALDVAIDEISSPDNKTFYFGLSEIRCFGFTLGPIFAGYLLTKGNPYLMCVSAACLFLLSSVPFFVNNTAN